jgi:plastocyanin
MLEIFLVLHRASRAEAPLFFFDTAACPCTGKAEGDIFFAVYKTRAHPAEAEPDCFLPLHDNLRLSIAFATTYRVSDLSGVVSNTRSAVGTKYCLFILTVHYENMSAHPRQIFYLACMILLVVSCLAAGCSSSPAPSAATTAPASGGGGNSVTIKNFAFDPSTLTMKAGTTVTWVNNDGASHALASDAGSPEAFSSSSLSTGASFTFTFTRPGTYNYHCSIHPSMTGTIIVQ